MFPALCGDPVLGFLMTNWVKNKVQLNNWSMPFRKPSFSKKLKTWKYFKIKWNLTILQLRFCILMAKFGISIKFWSRNMYDDVCMMTFQKCHFLSRIVTKISNCVKNKQKSLRYFVCYPHCFCVKTQKCSKWSPKNRVPVIIRVPTKVRVFWG